MRKKNIIGIVIGTGLILLVPLVAMQFTDEVDWQLPDFVIIGGLLIGSGLLYEFVRVKVNSKYRPVLAAAIVASVLLIWAELAVGILGTPFAGN